MTGQILILTNPTDYHSLAVREGLRRKGLEPYLWCASDFPAGQSASVWFGRQETAWEFDVPLLASGPPVTAIWLRRPERPVIPDRIEPGDREHAFHECTLFLRSLYREIGGQAFWVNPVESQARSGLKPQQLTAAVRAGFRIPRTLCSNNPDRIREFLRSQDHGVIYKSFSPMIWNMPDGPTVLFSTFLRQDDLPDDPILRLTPGIFQELIAKDYELRVTAFGGRLFAAKLRSQEVPSGKMDWRAAAEPVPTEPTDLPPAVAGACFRVMQDLGLAFGCFDIIVTPQGEHVFLEVNEAGAFLWIEEAVPEMMLLDAFCEFLIQGPAMPRWKPGAGSLRLGDVAPQVARYLEAEVKNSLPRPA